MHLAQQFMPPVLYGVVMWAHASTAVTHHVDLSACRAELLTHFVHARCARLQLSVQIVLLGVCLQLCGDLRARIRVLLVADALATQTPSRA